MASQPVQPLRIQKGGAGNSPSKMNGLPGGRPLAELSAMAVRRNSPSFPQNNKANIFKGDSSPFDTSPHTANMTNSPRLFWQGRDPTSPGRMSMENRSPYDLDPSPFPSKRSSIENLKKASRVKNSSMFEREQKNQYDPAQPTLLERPLANGRPLSMQFQGNAFGGRGLPETSSENTQPTISHQATTESSPDPHQKFAPPNPAPQISPSKNNVSPIKSSLSKRTGLNARHMAFDPENGIWSDDEDPAERKLPEGRGLHRHAKSVTFDRAPPQINEYEMTTPDPSSVASGSREGSYESVDEDEDVSFQSFERGSSMDHDDSFDASLEDTDKTPVVLPEDWRFMSPEHANTELAQHEEDVFDGEYGSPAPTAQPGSMEFRPHQTSVNSVDSNGQSRPLPPLPALTISKLSQPTTDNGVSDTMERISNAQRNLPSPPAASAVSKSDIRTMSGNSFSMEDRLRLMMLQEKQQEKSESELQRERRMRRAGSKESSLTRDDSNHSRDVVPNDEVTADSDKHPETETAPRISRESIIRRLQSEQDLYSEANDEDGPGPAIHSYRGCLPDPDVAIPSLEDPTQVTVEEVAEEHVVIKEELSDEADLYSISDYYGRQHGTDNEHDDDASEYSQPSVVSQPRLSLEEGQDTPRAHSLAQEPEKKQLQQLQQQQQQQPGRISLPTFTDFGESSSFDLGLESYLTPSPPTSQKSSPDVPHQVQKDETPQEKSIALKESVALEKSTAVEKPLPDLASLRESIQRPLTPEAQLEPPRFFGQGEEIAEPGTPDSVIRHPIQRSPSLEVDSPEPEEVPPAVPSKDESTEGRPPSSEHHYKRASINSSDSKECNQTAETLPASTGNTRISSLVQLEITRDHSDEGLGFGLEKEFDRVVEDQKVAFELSLSRLNHPFASRLPSSERPSHKDYLGPGESNTVLRNIPNLRPQGARSLPGDQRARGHCYPIDGNHFANRSPPRQRGYLMRQNTKVVVASNRVEDETQPIPAETDETEAVSEVAPSPRKISQPTWTAEPWNGKSRRKSIRGVDKSPRKKPVEGPAPPLPGQVSNVQDGLGSVQEDGLAEEEAEDFEDGAERGRLFVKVVGLKDLELPLPRAEQTQFALTLDNGLHCVTTAWLDLGRTAPIGQEFELVVLNELEFQLTLQMKLEEPKLERPQSPTKAPASPSKKQGTFGRLFGSPKKKKELEVQRQHEAQARQSVVRPQTPPSAYELVQGLVAKDGSFARAYVALSEHEKQSFGRPYTVDIMCFNEWAMEEVSVGSSRSKKGVTALQQKPPYPIGKLELQLLYIPKPKGAKDEDMPKSMNSAMRELREAEAREAQLRSNQNQAWEGHLSQQGGDCPYWRRRFFKLAGSKLTAYHESTLQPRATINLAKASKLIDDKSSLTQKEISTKGGGRRKSAFAEEEEGYMFVEEGFRIRFANGEVIDFYADSAFKKDEWMKVLQEVVGKGINSSSSSSQVKGWTEMVLKREKSIVAKDKKVRGDASPTKSSKDREQRLKQSPALAQAPDLPAPSPMHEQPPAGFDFGGLPSSDKCRPRSSQMPTRPTGHARTESYQPQSQLPQPTTSRSQAGSPVKGRTSREERHKKTKSMIDLMYH